MGVYADTFFLLGTVIIFSTGPQTCTWRIFSVWQLGDGVALFTAYYCNSIGLFYLFPVKEGLDLCLGSRSWLDCSTDNFFTNDPIDKPIALAELQL